MLDIEKHILDKLLPWCDRSSFCIAFSGGMDSTVLLHAVAHLAKQYRFPRLRAIYIEHGLQEVAQTWPAHCQRICAELQVPLTVITVDVAPTASVERAAREARYAAFAEHLHSDEVLLMAQHLDDQAETVLFRLLRGAGVSGLRGIPEQRALNLGYLLRPLLGLSRQQLQNYAQQRGLQWIEDPSNASDGFARNYLRQHIIPRLQTRWPALRSTLQRSAQHMQEAQQLLDELAELDLKHAQPQASLAWLQLPSLDLNAVRELSLARQKNLLRYWLAAFTLPPDSAHWQSWQTLRDAKSAASPLWRLQQGALLRSHNTVYWLPQDYLDEPPALRLTIACAGRYQLARNGFLIVSGELHAPLQIRYRQGAERLLIAGRGHRDVKRLLQEEGIPAFLRGRLPLVFQQDELVAIANLTHLNRPSLSKVTIAWQLVDEHQFVSK